VRTHSDDDAPRRTVVDKAWHELTTAELYSILKLRTDVFFVEQRIDETELDGRDLEPATRHVWIADDGDVVAYLRVLENPEPEHRDAVTAVGRVVVREDHRGEGLARELMEKVIADRPGVALVLHAQEYVAGLYARFGFERFGEPYVEAGIPHIGMYRRA
jgi:ElaA protein